VKDPYVFDFLTLADDARERELEQGLVEHVRDFLVELGVGFAFVGNQYHLEVGDQDFYLQPSVADGLRCWGPARSALSRRRDARSIRPQRRGCTVSYPALVRTSASRPMETGGTSSRNSSRFQPDSCSYPISTGSAQRHWAHHSALLHASSPSFPHSLDRSRSRFEAATAARQEEPSGTRNQIGTNPAAPAGSSPFQAVEDPDSAVRTVPKRLPVQRLSCADTKIQ
jgi:hypothetical protein